MQITIASSDSSTVHCTHSVSWHLVDRKGSTPLSPQTTGFAPLFSEGVKQH